MEKLVAEHAATAAGERFAGARRRTMELCKPLTAEDMMVQSCPEASPAKWHLAHTAWFFESFILREFVPGYRLFNPDFPWLFNSYYETFSEFPEKRLRSSFSRPGLEEILAYRAHVDEGIERLLEGDAHPEALRRIELGVNHEEQHQELLLTDILNAFFTNPLRPRYRLDRDRGTEGPRDREGRDRGTEGARDQEGREQGSGGARERDGRDAGTEGARDQEGREQGSGGARDREGGERGSGGARERDGRDPGTEGPRDREGRERDGGEQGSGGARERDGEERGSGGARERDGEEQGSGGARERNSPEFVEFEGGLREVGASGDSFCFDNEMLRHRVWLEPYALGRRLVTCGEFAEFMADGGYRRAELWLSAGWDTVKAQGWKAPLYWSQEDGEWSIFTLRGERRLAEMADVPVSQVSFYEADAFARWAGHRLPTEFEWEVAAEGAPVEGNLLDSGRLAPSPADQLDREQRPAQLYGDCWEWTASAYLGYPGFKPLDGTLGEYNGKFMSGQMVLRGGSCVTPQAHIRATYRNFFQPETRWQFSGIRLGKGRD